MAWAVFRDLDVTWTAECLPKQLLLPRRLAHGGLGEGARFKHVPL